MYNSDFFFLHVDLYLCNHIQSKVYNIILTSVFLVLLHSWCVASCGNLMGLQALITID